MTSGMLFVVQIWTPGPWEHVPGVGVWAHAVHSTYYTLWILYPGSDDRDADRWEIYLHIQNLVLQVRLTLSARGPTLNIRIWRL